MDASLTGGSGGRGRGRGRRERPTTSGDMLAATPEKMAVVRRIAPRALQAEIEPTMRYRQECIDQVAARYPGARLTGLTQYTVGDEPETLAPLPAGGFRLVVCPERVPPGPRPPTLIATRWSGATVEQPLQPGVSYVAKPGAQRAAALGPGAHYVVADLQPKHPDRACSACGMVGLKFQLCARCRSARYCNGECQKWHWQHGHKQECKPVDAAEEQAAGEQPSSAGGGEGGQQAL